ncbi:efflux RND transporter permease subunit [Lichenifustis flavocetrariae]|uniref:Efflux RND transporter permease subunit n=1 Tax=Lichenifustis flavocetrariae TaxID=2949735 RepID=A0AA41Z511_9HYPH|nr:efflux RND transporter permease subunit [Lichenifustis flavocetrariae]MCW6513078.1 efflux RND transporter permease subunit [Lichenifustis flavocetrariae]
MTNGLSSWSIRHPISTIVLFLGLTLAGLLGFSGLRTNNLPDIDLPSVTVTVSQPGAAPSELETQATRIVEDALAGISNIDHISSTVSEGTSVTTVQFLISANIDRATNDVRNAVSSVQSKLPAAAEQPVVQRVDSTGNAILTFALDAPNKTIEAQSWLVNNDIAKTLLGVTGVSKIERAGGVDRAIRLRLDADRLMALGVTATKLSQALAGVNVDQPGGRMDVGGREQTVRTVGGATTLSQLADVAVSGTGSTAIRLRDLGRLDDSWSEARQRARFDGREVVAFSVYRTMGSSEVDVAKGVRRAVASMNASDAGLHLEEVTSSTGFVQDAYDASVETLWIGALLAIGIVWIFLRDWRATLVSAVALPLSLIPTFAVMDWYDISLNTITLLALSLVIGILVDDAIVEIENIVRHMRGSGRTAYQAAIEAADEIGLAVVATTATLIAVFLPVAFMAGIPGKIFAAFALATCVSVAFSLLVARMLTPLMAAYLVRADGHEEQQPVWLPAYLAVLRLALRHRAITVVLGLLFFTGSMGLATRLPVDFMAAADRGRSLASVTLPPGATLDQTDAVVLAMNKILRAYPEVTTVYATEGAQTQAGIGAANSAGEVNTATVTINLKPRGKRGRSQQQLEKLFTEGLRAIPGARIQFGADGQSGAKLTVTLVGDDPTALSRVVDQLQVEMRGVRGIMNPYSTASLAKPEIVITPKTDQAAERGVTTSAIADAVKIATVGDIDQSLPKFNLADRQLSIVVSLDEHARSDPAMLANLPVAGSSSTVPLGSVADIGFAAGPSEITRFDRRRSMAIEAAMDGITLGEAGTAISSLPTMRDLPAGVHEEKSGDSERLGETTHGFATAIVTGVVLMYFTLVLLFGGFIQPLTILVALPLSFGGALGLLYLCGYALSITALIGLLMLMGIAAKNSILLVDYALMALRDTGLPIQEALLDAARKRARPIIMTSLAMGGGMLPIALGYGTDAESRAPMAVAVIGGLASSTVLSLVYVPVVFSLMHGLQRRAGGLLARLFLENAPQALAPPLTAPAVMHDRAA